MAQLSHYHTLFQESNFYHVYNRAVDKRTLFKNDDNYSFFLKQYDKYLSPVTDTYAFCLLDNHFHILLRVHDLPILKEQFPSEGPDGLDAHNIVSHQFRKFFQSYALAFNRQQERSGTLFQTPFKRAWVNSDSYFTQLVYYIHANPQKHGLANDFRDWKWSSYNRILLDKPSRLKKKEVIDWFGGKESYRHFHSQEQILAFDKVMIEG